MSAVLIVLGVTLVAVAAAASILLRKREAVPSADDPWLAFSPRTDAEVDDKHRNSPWFAVAMVAGMALVVAGVSTLSSSPGKVITSLGTPIPLSAPAQLIDANPTATATPLVSPVAVANGDAVSDGTSPKPGATRRPARGGSGSGGGSGGSGGGGGGGSAPVVTPTPKPTPTPPPPPSISITGKSCNGFENKFNVTFRITAPAGTTLGLARITAGGTPVYSENNPQGSRTSSGSTNGGSVILSATSHGQSGRTTTTSMTICP